MTIVAENKAIVHSLIAPIIFESIQEPGKRYIIADGEWTEIHNDINKDNIVWFKRPYEGGKHSAFKSTAEWQVDGSKGKKYTVKASDDSWSCSCPAYGWSGAKRSCKHIEQIKTENGWK